MKRKNKKFIIGVDVGGTNIKIGLLDPSGRIYRKKSLSTNDFPGKKSLINGLIGGIRQILGESKVKRGSVLGIGIGTPGLVDSSRGVIHYLVNIKGFREVPLKQIIEHELKIPAFLDNDVNIMCLGELHFGRGMGAKNIVCITLGTGVGGGIAIMGDLYRGASLSAGEVGHITINEDGPLCGCGNRGCMEAYAGNAYIVKDAIRRIRKNKRTLIYRQVAGDLSRITPKVISEAAKKGDRLAVDVLRCAGEHIGTGLANIVNILNPEKIIIGGGVAESGKMLFDTIRSSVRKRAMEVPARAVKIVKARLGNDAGLIGAVALVKNAIR